ncbi:MAG: 23S rRNA (pseudouridine(1915)-N(3))-methyltransferase RlmH [Bacteroidetes bacterium]|nr:23S rRNA (pseudouridine(1915)-N(3))-methyltransferase RlmH [Bacteroidota bacterium]
MKIQFYTIGREHELYVKPGVEDFTKRITRYYPVNWKIIVPPKNAAVLPEAELIQKEAGLLFELLKNDDYLIALDENGKLMNSPELAAFLQTRANESTKQIIFLIGGAYGLHESVLNRANYIWSLSKLTFPHQLVRLILAEQIYRACTILRNEKYHHS